MPVQQLLPFIMVGIVLISLAVLRVSLHLSRFGSAFVRGVSHTTRSGEPYFWYYSPPRRHNRGVAELSIAADIPFEFTLENENRAHWLAEKLGFASKYQTDDPEFDRQVYVASDDPEFCDQLHNKAQMRRNVEYLFKNGFRSLTAKPHCIAVVMQSPIPSLSENDADAVVHYLGGFKKSLPTPAMLGGALAHPNRLRAKLVNFAIIGVFSLGIVAALVDAALPYITVRWLDLTLYSCALAVSAIAEALIFINILFYKSSLGYGVIKNFRLFGLIGIVLCSREAVFNINTRADNSLLIIHEQTIVNKYVTHGRHSGTHYHISVMGWNSSPCFSMETDYRSYARARIGIDMLMLFSHPGNLGYEWIEKYQIVTK
ncbi:MAG: hypothetical protein WA231_18505 [Methylocella sp.]